jgi:uncharacterized membrane protein
MVPNPLLMNDWPRKRMLVTVLTLQFLVWALIGLDAAGVQIPLLRGLFASVYLLFVPGMLVLRALRLHHMGGVRTPLFAVGLSLALVMGVGLCMTTLYPLLGFARPLALVPVVMTEGVIITFLAVLSYWRDQGPTEDGIIDRRDVLKPPVLALCVLPFVSIFATYAMNAYGNNVLLLALIIIIAITAFWISTSASVPKELYPLAVFVIAVALLYHGSLISPYVWGWDIQKEVYTANAVLTNAQWNAYAPGATNAVLSVTLLAPLISILSGVSVVWIFKAIYPLLFALVPVGLFVVFQKQTSDRVALLASFFVIFLFTFFTEMPALARQEIAELFLVLLLILLVDKGVGGAAGKARLYALYTIFAVSVIVSHYALAFIFIGYLVVAWLLLFLVDNPAMRRLYRIAHVEAPAKTSSRPKRMLTLPFILVFVALTVVWYATLGSAALSDGIDQAFAQVSHTLFTSLNIPLVIGISAAAYACALAIVYMLAARAQRKAPKSPRLFGALAVVLSASLALARYNGISINELLEIGMLSPLHEIAEFLYLLGLLLIFVGLAALALRRCRFKFDLEFAALALASFVILMTAVAIPILASTIDTTRLYHISTLLLAPFCVTGALLIGAVPGRLRAKRREKTGVSLAYKLVAALFVIMLFFSTGFIYEVIQQDPTSFFLNNAIDAARFNQREVVAAQWLFEVKGAGTGTAGLPVYADVYRGLLWTSFDLNHSLGTLGSPAAKTPRAGYVYLGTFNLLTGTSAQLYPAKSFLNGTLIYHTSLAGIADTRNRVFDDGGAVIYYH